MGIASEELVALGLGSAVVQDLPDGLVGEVRVTDRFTQVMVANGAILVSVRSASEPSNRNANFDRIPEYKMVKMALAVLASAGER